MYAKPFVSIFSYRTLPTHVVQLLTRLNNREKVTIAALTKLCLQRNNLRFNVVLCFHIRIYACSGWTMVFKAVSGIAKEPWKAFSSDFTSGEIDMKGLDLTNNFRKHYKSRIVLFWENFGPAQASVSLK